MRSHTAVLILDYGSQYTQLIARRIRELGIYSVIIPGDSSLEKIRSFSPRAIILSGGPSSVYDVGAPQLAPGLLEYQEKERIPVLGICYGMQLLARDAGGRVETAKVREYGRMEVFLNPNLAGEGLFPKNIYGTTGSFLAWMSHGDEVLKVPPGFAPIAQSASGSVAGMECLDRRIFALQFHPEVTHTEGGREILRRFLIEMAGISSDWNMDTVLEEQVQKIRDRVGPQDHVICALSGGVDSVVAASLVRTAIGDRLHCFFVDHGLLRLNEAQQVMKMFQEQLQLPVKCLDHSERFLRKLEGVVDPEQKRKIIGAEFIASFESAAEAISKEVGALPKFLVQGTLYPDVIESSPSPADQSKKKHSHTIKSHHNVGGAPC